MGRPLFTPEELEVLRRDDEALEEDFCQTQEEITQSRKRDRAAVIARMDPKKRQIAERNAAYYKANKDKIAERKAAWAKRNRAKRNGGNIRAKRKPPQVGRPESGG